MAVDSYRTETRKVRVEICTAEDGTVFEGDDARYRAGQHESKLETLRDLDALFARDPAVVKAAIIANFKDEDDDGALGLWCFLHDIEKHLPKGGHDRPRGGPGDAVTLTPSELRNLLDVSWRDGHSRPEIFDDEWPQNMRSDVDQTNAEIDKWKALGVPKEAYPDHEEA